MSVYTALQLWFLGVNWKRFEFLESGSGPSPCKYSPVLFSLWATELHWPLFTVTCLWHQQQFGSLMDLLGVGLTVVTEFLVDVSCRAANQEAVWLVWPSVVACGLTWAHVQPWWPEQFWESFCIFSGCASRCHECDVWRTPGGSFSQVVTKVHLHSGMIYILEAKGQISR